jgi:hypothetical protein
MKRPLAGALGAGLAGLAGLARLRRGWTHRHDELRLRVELALRFEPRTDDVFIAGYPRSGATLVQMMLLALTGAGDLGFLHVASRSPTLDLELLRGNARFLAALPSPRLLRSFRRREELPRRGRFIYVARDLLDVAVSAYHYDSLLAGRDADLERFLRRFPRKPLGLSCSWVEHLRSWGPQRGAAGVLFLNYDEMVADLDGTIRRVAAFCALGLDERELPRIRERCELGFMKRHAEKFDPRLRQLSPRPLSFIRRGESGTGRRELSPAHRELFAARLAALARRLDVDPGEPLARLFRAEPE